MELTPKQILIVEDQPSSCEWLQAAALAAFPGAQVRLAHTAAAALALADADTELVLLDLGLPDASGLHVLEALHRRHPATACVITTIFDDDEHLFTALRLGARGYVLKDQSREHLSQMLLDMLAGQPPLSPGVARRLLSHFMAPVAVAPAAANDGLTEREREVLQLVSKGYSVPQAAKAMEISPHTAHSHIKGVYRKLAVASRAEAVLAANRLGLV
ncbi:MAG: response regulator transcription factor [Stagnimonas sp.]|nr:response regulator transcription factor [Stagnimonas sp.]